MEGRYSSASFILSQLFAKINSPARNFEVPFEIQLKSLLRAWKILPAMRFVIKVFEDVTELIAEQATSLHHMIEPQSDQRRTLFNVLMLKCFSPKADFPLIIKKYNLRQIWPMENAKPCLDV